MTTNGLPYRRIVTLDTEYHAPSGERPCPICVCWSELHTGEHGRLWLWDALALPCPFNVGPDTLYVTFYAPAEWGTFLAMGWPLPVRVLDLYAEFRRLTSGLPVPCGRGLLGALAYHGLPGMAADEKDAGRQLAIRGGPYTDAERAALLDYCAGDVDATERLLNALLPGIDLPRALLRGRYTAAVARMEQAGVPLDIGAEGPGHDRGRARGDSRAKTLGDVRATGIGRGGVCHARERVRPGREGRHAGLRAAHLPRRPGEDGRAARPLPGPHLHVIASPAAHF